MEVPDATVVGHGRQGLGILQLLRRARLVEAEILLAEVGFGARSDRTDHQAMAFIRWVAKEEAAHDIPANAGTFHFGLQGGPTMEKLAVSTAPLTSNTWRGMPVLVIVLLGGFTINFLWCLLLNLKNRTAADYIRPEGPVLLANIVFAAVAGAIWCSQFICLKTGEPAMGKTAYIGFAILMAGQILFSSLLGAAIGEWRGTSGKTKTLLGFGLLLLVASFVVAACSSYLSQQA